MGNKKSWEKIENHGKIMECENHEKYRFKKSWEITEKIMGKSWKNVPKIMGNNKSWEKHRNNIKKSWETKNHGKIMGNNFSYKLTNLFT